MRVQVQGNEQALAEAMRSYIERRLRLTLGRYVGELSEVMVRVAAANGPTGATGGGCQIRAELIPFGQCLHHEVDDPCLFSAVDAAVDRMGRSVRRVIGQEAPRVLRR